jgi:hypothetical protein
LAGSICPTEDRVSASCERNVAQVSEYCRAKRWPSRKWPATAGMPTLARGHRMGAAGSERDQSAVSSTR